MASTFCWLFSRWVRFCCALSYPQRLALNLPCYARIHLVFHFIFIFSLSRSLGPHAMHSISLGRRISTYGPETGCAECRSMKIIKIAMV